MASLFNPVRIRFKEEEKILKIEQYFDIKIENIVIHSIPLLESEVLTIFRFIGKRLQNFIHPKLSPTLSHIAIQLNLENDDIFIIEYGPYIRGKSNIKTICEMNNDNEFYYINKDGVRITKINKEKYLCDENSKKYPSETILKIIASEKYKKRFEEFNLSIEQIGIFNGYYSIKCNINKKITIKELIDNFKNEKWEAKKYHFLTHNCQDFGAEVIKFLEATRKYRKDKIRTNEKMALPNCIISVLWDNEKLSIMNTIGRIPLIGMGFDILANIYDIFAKDDS